MKVTVLDCTNKPLQKIGRCAGECYNSPVDNAEKNIKRAKAVLDDRHYRNLELARVTLKIEGISARLGRELYTHIGGSPTRLQASTRYITYGNFDYVMPDGLTEEQQTIYESCMHSIAIHYDTLKKAGCDNDVAGYLLPLGMTTTIVIDINMRTLLSMAEQRMCKLALKEFQDLMKVIKRSVSEIDEEWLYLTSMMKPKCAVQGQCFEKRDCELKRILAKNKGE